MLRPSGVAAGARTARHVLVVSAILFGSVIAPLASLAAGPDDELPSKSVAVSLDHRTPLAVVLSDQLPDISVERGFIPAGELVLLYEFKGTHTWSGGQVFDVGIGDRGEAEAIADEFNSDYEAMLRIQLMNATAAREAAKDDAWTWDDTISDLSARLREYEQEGILLSGYEVKASSVDIAAIRDSDFAAKVVVSGDIDRAALEAAQ